MRRRLIILIVCGLILVAAAAFYVQFWLTRPVGEGPAGPAVAGEPFAKSWTTRKVLLLGLGDSVTAGFGVAPSHSYFRRLADNPSDEFPEMKGICLRAVLPNLAVKNKAVSGSTSLHHVEHIRKGLEVQPADVFGLVVMTTGGNDLIHNYGRTPPREGAMYGATLDEAQPWIAAFEKRLNLIVDLLEERFPGGCLIFLADIYDPTDGVGDAPSVWLPAWPDGLAIHAAYNEVIHRCARQRSTVRLVPMHAEFLGHGSHCRQFWREHYRREDPYYWFGPNIEDPNIRGYDAIRRVFLNEIARAAEEIAKVEKVPAKNRPLPPGKVGVSKSPPLHDPRRGCPGEGRSEGASFPNLQFAFCN